MSSNCQHGATGDSNFRKALNEMRPDLTLVYHSAFGTKKLSNKDRKKVLARLEKQFARIDPNGKKNPEDGKQAALAELHGLAAQSILCNDKKDARLWSTYAIRLQALSLQKKQPYNPYELMNPRDEQLAIDQILSDQGVTLFAAKNCPCGCLKALQRDIKKNQVKIGICWHCCVEKPIPELFHCSHCRRASFCSENCHQMDWVDGSMHKTWCAEWAKST